MDSGSYLAISGEKLHLLIHTETSGESRLSLATQALREISQFLETETENTSQRPHSPSRVAASSSRLPPRPAQPSDPSKDTSERIHLASLAGIAAADRFLGRKADTVPKATNLKNRVYLVCRDKDGKDYIPAKRFTTWTETAALVELSRGRFSETAIFQAFPAAFEADSFDYSFTIHLASSAK